MSSDSGYRLRPAEGFAELGALTPLNGRKNPRKRPPEDRKRRAAAQEDAPQPPSADAEAEQRERDDDEAARDDGHMVDYYA